MEFVRKREARKRSPKPGQDGRRPIYGMPGQFAADPNDLRARAQQEYPELR